MDNMNNQGGAGFSNGSSDVLTVRNIIRGLSVAAIIFFFLPAVYVSVSFLGISMGEGISAAVAMTGGYPAMVFAIIVPILILVATFLKTFIPRYVILITLIASAVDFIVWIVFNATLSSAVGFLGTGIEVQAGFVLSIIVIIALIVFSALVFFNKLELDVDLRSGKSKGGSFTGFNFKSGNAGASFCPNCGASVPKGSTFCGSCGQSVSGQE